MKKLSISMFALAAIAFSACTSDDVTLSGTENNVVTGGDGYISLAINLPTTPSTRADNDVYDDGLESEYAVYDATLLLFEGSSEDDAVCYETYDLGTTFNLENTDNGNITSRQQLTQKIDSPVSGDLYVMVILNDNGMKEAVGGYIGKNLEDLKTTVVNLGGVEGMTKKGLFMTNAPLINATGVNAASGVVTTLAHIDSSKIYASQSIAEANPATDIYVERGMAKVTLTAENSYTVNLGDGDITVTVDGFTLNQTNNVTYPVRNTLTSNVWWGYASGNASVTSPYRFAGNVIVDANALYRTYWALDPNYDEAPADGQLSIIDPATAEFGGIGNENPQYCLENTFDVDHMIKGETTQAIIMATFDGGDFYIWDGNKSILYDEDGILSLALNMFRENSAVEEALQTYKEEVNFFTEYVTASIVDTEASDDATIAITISPGLIADCFSDDQVPDVFTTGLDEVVAEINEAHTVGYYKGGVNYYSVLIKHFGDDLTPWDLETITAGGNYENSYPDGIWSKDADNNWLGRYGVLRNNWYDITIDAIAGPGSATPPLVTGEDYNEPDDPTETWISFRINILSWAKRTQIVTL